MAGGDRTNEPTAREIAQLLRSNAEALGMQLFPNARSAGGFLCVGSIHGEPGDSLKITLRGPKAGTWADYAESPGSPTGMGDMLKLVQHVLCGGDLGAAVKWSARWLNLGSMDPREFERLRLAAEKAQKRAEANKADDDERKRANAEGLWKSAAPLTPSSPAFRYLAGRGIDFSVLGHLPGAIRFHHAVSHAESGKKLPAMVTRFNALDGTFAASHVTFLHYAEPNGWTKLPKLEIDGKTIDASKKIHSPRYWGAHIPLWKGEQRCTLRDVKPGTPIEVSEGIEDGLSYAMANPKARVLAAGTLGNIGEMKLPPQAGMLTILAQNDTKPEPIAALEAAIAQQQRQALAQGSARAVAQRRPPQGIKDWNDWLRAGAE